MAERERLEGARHSSRVATARDTINRDLHIFNACFDVTRVEHKDVGGNYASPERH